MSKNIRQTHQIQLQKRHQLIKSRNTKKHVKTVGNTHVKLRRARNLLDTYTANMLAERQRRQNARAAPSPPRPAKFFCLQIQREEDPQEAIAVRHIVTWFTATTAPRLIIDPLFIYFVSKYDEMNGFKMRRAYGFYVLHPF